MRADAPSAVSQGRLLALIPPGAQRTRFDVGTPEHDPTRPVAVDMYGRVVYMPMRRRVYVTFWKNRDEVARTGEKFGAWEWEAV